MIGKATSNPTRQVVLYLTVAFVVFLASGGSVERLKRTALTLKNEGK